MPFKLRIPGLSQPEADPYWDNFINKPLKDPKNLPADGIRAAPEGSVFAVRSETHTPEILAGHMKELAKFYGADAVGIVRRRTSAEEDYPFALVCAFKTDYDPRVAHGIGGQKAALHGSFVTFNMGGTIREYGFRATKAGLQDAERLAVLAGLGTMNAEGRVVSPTLGPLYVADVIYTDLPVAPDAEERA